MRGVSAVAAQHVEGVPETAGVGDRRTRRDDARIVADHVGDGERLAGAARARRQPPAFDRRLVFPHGVELANIGTSPQEAVGGRPFVFERQAFRGDGHERGRAAG